MPDNIAWPKPGDKFWERPPATDRGVEPRNVRKDSRTFHVIHIGAEARRAAPGAPPRLPAGASLALLPSGAPCAAPGLRRAPLSAGGTEWDARRDGNDKQKRAPSPALRGPQMAPVAKVGGLGDVVTGLARAGRARGHWTEARSLPQSPSPLPQPSSTLPRLNNPLPRRRRLRPQVYLPFYELLNDKLKNVEHVMDFEFSVVRPPDPLPHPFTPSPLRPSQPRPALPRPATPRTSPPSPTALIRPPLPPTPSPQPPQGRPWDGEVQWNPLKTSVFRSEVMGVPVFLFRPDNNWFKGAQIYGGPTTEAYLYFSRAALVR